MNFKRFISSVSAFSIAASAFAAMTVTASAYNIETAYTATDKTLVWSISGGHDNIGSSGREWSQTNDFADIVLVSKNGIWSPTADAIASCSRSMVYNDDGKGRGGMYGYIVVKPKYSGTLTMDVSVADSGGTATKDYTTTFYVEEGDADYTVENGKGTNSAGDITVKGGGTDRKTFTAKLEADKIYYVYGESHYRDRNAPTVHSLKFTPDIENAIVVGTYEGDNDGSMATAFSKTLDLNGETIKAYVTSDGTTKTTETLATVSGSAVIGVIAKGINDTNAAATLILK